MRVPYIDDAGNEVDDVAYHVLPKLSWDDFRSYMDLAATVDKDSAADLDKVAEFLIDRGFVRFEGVLTADGSPLEKADWRKAPDDLLLQVVRKLQTLNAIGGVRHPNSQAPSAPSSEAAGEQGASNSDPTSLQSLSTPSDSPTQ
jgi:hypothetical protein